MAGLVRAGHPHVQAGGLASPELTDTLQGGRRWAVPAAEHAEARRRGVARARLRALLTGLIMVSLVALLALRTGGDHAHRGSPLSPLAPESKVAACRT